MYIENTSGYNFSTDNIHMIFRNAVVYYPELTYAMDKTSSFVWYKKDTNGNVVYFAPNDIIRIDYKYFDLAPGLSHATIQSNYDRDLNEACFSCYGTTNLDEMKSMTDLEKIILAHDWIVANVQYDPYVSHNNTDFVTPSGRRYTYDPSVYSSYGVFTKKNAVCQGYSLAFKALVNRAGIPCLVVSSDPLNHAWNMVYLDGNWYHVDVTWDDPKCAYPGDLSEQCGGVDVAGHVEHNYILCSDTQFAYEKGHTKNKGTIDWSTEFGISCPYTYTLNYSVATSNTAYFRYSSCIIGTVDNQVNYYYIGSNFQNGWNRSLPSAPFSAAIDKQTGSLFLKPWYGNSVYDFNINDGVVKNVLTAKYSFSGIKLEWLMELYGITLLCEYRIYDPYMLTALNIDGTDTNMPVNYVYASLLSYAWKMSGGKVGGNIAQYINDKTLNTNDILTYAAGYDVDRRMISLTQLTPDINGLININNSLYPENISVLKIITIARNGVPLAGVVELSAY